MDEVKGPPAGAVGSTLDGASALESLPQLTPQMRRDVAAAYRHGVLQTPVPLALADLNARVIATNGPLQALSGYSDEQLVGRLATDLAHHEDRPAIAELLASICDGHVRWGHVEARWVREDGRVVWARTEIFRLDDDVAGRSYLLGLLEDVTRERLAQRQAGALLDVARLVSVGAPLHETAERIAAVAEDRWSGVGCSLTVLDDSRQWLLPVAHGRLPDGYLDMLPPIPAGPGGAACGDAVWRGERSVISDLRTDPRAELFRDAAHRFGVVSAWSVPLIDPAGVTVGAFGVFHPCPRVPDGQDWDYLENLGRVAGLAVFVNAERRLREAEQAQLRRDRLTQTA